MLTLFDSCISFIASNIHLVESFEGFPDILSEKIFKTAERKGKFSVVDNACGSLQALSLFTSVYHGSVLGSVSFEGQHLALANAFQHLQTFRHLKSLNVSCCGLGDDHELLFHISRLPSLQVLALHDNALSDDGIRKMTAPIRVKKEGPLSLQCLDLSENPKISGASLKYLRVFRRLLFLDVTSTRIKQCEQAAQEFSTAMSLWPQLQFPELRDLLDMKTMGWAAETVQRWIQETEQGRHPHSSRQDQHASSAGTKRFYGKTRPLLADISNNAPKTAGKRRRSSTLALVSCNFTEGLASLGMEVTDSCGPSLSTLPANFSQQATVSQDFKAATSNRTVNTQVSLVSEKCRQCIHLDNTEPPPAKFQKVSRLFSRSILQTGDAVQQNVKEVQASGKQQMLCDEDTLLLSQYGYTGH